MLSGQYKAADKYLNTWEVSIRPADPFRPIARAFVSTCDECDRLFVFVSHISEGGQKKSSPLTPLFMS